MRSIGITMACMSALLWAATAFPQVTLYFDPPEVGVPFDQAGMEFTAELRVKGVTDLFGFEVRLDYDESALKILSIEEGDLLKSGGVQTFFNAIKEDDKLVGAYSTRLGADVAGVEGEGTLLKVTFKVLRAEELEVIPQAKLSDSNAREIKVDEVKPLKITLTGEEIIKEHEEGSPMLALEARFPVENQPGRAYIVVWKGSFEVKEGMFLEYQIYMPSGNPHFKAGVELHTSDGTVLGELTDPKPVDQNDLPASPSTDLEGAARDRWYHRIISLDPLVGKVIDAIMIATSSDQHRAGLFRAFVDNIQITNGKFRVLDVYIDDENVPATGGPESTLADVIPTEGVEDAKVTVTREVSVDPRGKLPAVWGGMKLR